MIPQIWLSTIGTILRYIILGIILAGLFQVFFWISQDHELTLNQNSFDRIESLSYTPYEGNDKKMLPLEKIKEDTKVLSFFTKKLRTYSTDDAEIILKVLTKNENLKIDLGIWLSSNYKENFYEISRAVELTKKYPQFINSVIVGNEVLLRKDLSEKELISYVDFVSSLMKIPVTTAETWDEWEKVPSLAKHVDFVTIHILPYWEGITIDTFDSYVLDKYERIKKLFPKKK